MILHSQVCNYCGEQSELPSKCEEDDSFNNTKGVVSKLYGISLDLSISPIKSFEGYNRRGLTRLNLTFCSKECTIEFIKKNLSEKGVLEILK